MKCPVCEKEMVSTVCACGYDESRNYERYPTLEAPAPGAVTVSAMQKRRNELVRCSGCGGQRFTLSRKTGELACASCGRGLTAAELKPLTDALQKKKEIQKAALEATIDDVAGFFDRKFGREDPKRIVSIAAGHHHTVALYADGTVAAIGNNKDGACEVSKWREITAIAAGFHHTTGVRRDGTVVTAGSRTFGRNEAASWTDIVSVSEGTFHIVGLKRDGTVVSAGDKAGGKRDVSGWRNIVAVSAGNRHTLGLDKYGRVYVAGKGKGTKLPWSGWKNVQAIAAGYEHSAALTTERTVLIAGDGGKPEALGGGNAALGAGWRCTIVRREDGTAAASGVNTAGQCNIEDWTDLEQISVSENHTVGLKRDGTLVAVGSDKSGQCDVEKLVRK